MNEGIRHMRWVSTGEIVSNDGETATAEIPARQVVNGSVSYRVRHKAV